MPKEDKEKGGDDITGSAPAGVPAPPIPPDGGWGWVIMLSSFMVNVIVDGVCFSFGIFYLEFLEYYGESKGKTSWVGSVLNGMYLSMGPIVSALANRFGCRKVSIAGSIIATAAFLLSTFSPNVDVLILLYGGLGGFGFGLMYLPAIVMVGFYFEKRRAFATGVAVCGSGIGAFVFAPLCEKLLSYYHWKGATFIIAGLVLNGVLCGALFRPLEPSIAKKTESVPQIVLTSEECATCSNGDLPHNRVRQEDRACSHTDITKQEVEGQPRRVRTTSLPGEESNHPDKIKNIEFAKAQNDIYLQSMQNLGPKDKPTCDKMCKSMDDIVFQNGTPEVRKRTRLEELRRPLYKKDIFYSGSIVNLDVYKSADDMQSYVQSVTKIPDEDDEDTRQCTHRCTGFLDTLRTMLGLSLLKNPVFAIYGASCFLCMAGFYVPFIYLPDHAIERNMTRDQAAFLLSIIGIANTIARVGCGWVSDQSWADSLLINNLALIVGGAATMAAPHCGSYGLLATYASVFGASIAVFVSLRSILMVELIGLDQLTNAFGLVTMCQGLSAFIGAPIAGLLYDWTGNYNVSFYSAGASLALAGIICLPLRKVARWQQRREASLSVANKTYSALSEKEASQTMKSNGTAA